MKKNLFKFILLISLPIYLYGWFTLDFSALDNIKKIGADLEGISDLNKDLNSTLSSIDNLFKGKASNSTKVPSDANLSQNKKIPTDQCKCILFEENNLIINLTNFNRRESFVVSATLASDQNYSQSYFCMTNLRVDRKDFWCIDDYDSWNLWFRVNDKEDFKVKFGDTIRLDGEYDQTVDGTVSKDIVIKDTTNYIQGKCIPCL